MIPIEEIRDYLYDQLKDKEPFKSYSMDQQGEVIIKFVEAIELLRQPLNMEE